MTTHLAASPQHSQGNFGHGPNELLSADDSSLWRWTIAPTSLLNAFAYETVTHSLAQGSGKSNLFYGKLCGKVWADTIRPYGVNIEDKTKGTLHNAECRVFGGVSQVPSLRRCPSIFKSGEGVEGGAKPSGGRFCRPSVPHGKRLPQAEREPSSPPRKKRPRCICITVLRGGEGGTRTLAPVTRPTPLAGVPRHQLEYFSKLISAFAPIQLCQQMIL